MMWRTAAGIGLAAAVSLSDAASAAPVTGASLTLASDHTRIVLESDAPIRFSLFALRNPDRVLLDLEGVDLQSVAKALSLDAYPAHPYIAPPRVVRTGAGKVRIELELKTEIEPRISSSRRQGGRGYRITLDLYPPEAAIATPAQSASSAPLAAAAVARAPAPPLPVAGDEEILLAVQVNGQPMTQDIMARRSGGRFLVRDDDLRRWRMRAGGGVADSSTGERYQALEALPGLAYRIDEASLTLFVDAPAALFDATALTGQKPVFVAPPPAPAGAFANYDLFATRSAGVQQASAQLEFGAFNTWGVGVTNFLGRSSVRDAHWVRLDSTWTHDMPDNVSTLRIGDAIGSAGSWGRAVRFGGVQYATNFGTQPGFITFPLPGFAGEAALPSTVDLFVNDALRMRREVPTGPFSIQDLPVVTGRGDMRLVVRDALGREHVIVQPFYASAQLLQAGLHAYSYELGLIRENFAISSNDYGRAVAAATHRVGFSDRFTGEVRGEVLRRQQTAGVGGAFLLPDIGLFSASLAASHGPDGQGALAGVGFERQSPQWGVGASTQLASSRFVQLGLQPGEPAPRQLSRAFASYSSRSLGSVALSYTHQDYRDRPGVELLSASYSLSLGRFGFISFTALQFLGGDGRTTFGLNYTQSLDSSTTASAGATVEHGSREGQVQLQRNLPAGPGYGYRVLAAAGDSTRFEAGASAQTDFGTYVVEGARAQGETAYRASASGGVAVVGWRPFLSRRMDGSFGVVDLPGYPGVRIYEANQLVARTGSSGTALIPRLLAYQKNTVRIEQADLPMDAQIDTYELDAVPWFRSGVRIPFPIKRSRGAMLTLLMDSGTPMPAGAVVRVGDAGEDFPVGLRGEVYVSGLDPTNRLRASWRGQSCDFVVAFPPTEDPLPNLGTFACKGVSK